jgi:gentisate 1,2-dioxygenase
MVDILQPSTPERLAALQERMAGWSLAGHWQPRRPLPPLAPQLWRWEAHSHRNTSNTQPAILFSVSDRPVLEVIGLYRVEEE